MMKLKRFEDIEVWKFSLELVNDIYTLTYKEEFSKDFSLKDQIRKAAISISSNIAEGYERSSNNELIRFLRIAKGSAGEVRSQLYVAFNLKYITKKEFDEVLEKLISISSQISNFTSYLINKRKNNEFTSN